MRYINFTTCYRYKLPYGEGIYSNPSIPVRLENLELMADNADKVDCSGVNNVCVMLESRDSKCGRIIQYSGYTAERGLFCKTVE